MSSELITGDGQDEAGVDDERIARFLLDEVPGLAAPFSVSRVAGGHSCLTYIITDGNGRKVVLRRPPMGEILASAHDVLREHKIMKALEHTPVPVPVMLASCSDKAVHDAPFYVMDFVSGIVLHDARMVPELMPDIETRRNASRSMVDALVALHSVDVDAVGLGDLSRRSGYLDRQLNRWHRQWTASKTRELPAMEKLHEWLVANKPEEGPARIAHGDFRLGNALHAPDGEVLAILDWELCTLGDPLADLSYLLRAWVPPGEQVRGSIIPASAAGGFYTHDELIARYEEGTGAKLTDLTYWLAFHAWRSAAIGEGVYRRYLDGNMGEVALDLQAFGRSVELGALDGLATAGLTLD